MTGDPETLAAEMERAELPRFDFVDADMAAVLRGKTPAERLAIAHGMWEHARGMITSFVRSRQPGISDGELQREVARRLSHGAV